MFQVLGISKKKKEKENRSTSELSTNYPANII